MAVVVLEAETAVEVEDLGELVVGGEVLEEDRVVEILLAETVGGRVEVDHEGARETAVVEVMVQVDLAEVVEAVMARAVNMVASRVLEG